MSASPEQAAGPRSAEIRAAAFAILIGLAALAGSLGLASRSATMNAGQAVGAVAVAVTVGAVFAFRPRMLALLFVFCCIAIPDILERTFLPLGFMKLYIQDVVFLLNAVLIGVRLSVGRGRLPAVGFHWFVGAYFLLGMAGVANGLLFTGNAYDDVLGDFRRSFFYFMNYFVFLLLVDTPRDRDLLERVMFAGTGSLVLLGLFQMVTGQFHTRRFDDAAHILGWREITFLSFGVFYGLARALLAPGNSRLPFLAFAAAGLLVTAVGNFRATWLGMAGGLLFMGCFLPRNRRVQFAGIAVSTGLAMALLVGVFWDAQVFEGRTLGQELMAKANVSGATDDINVIWRFQSYQAAYQEWLGSPVFGTGLGTYLQFHVPTSTGTSMLADGHNVHNSLLWILMVLGIVGLGVTLAMHGAFLLTAVRFLRSGADARLRATVLACACFYISMMIATLFQNFLENATPVTVFSAVAALTMLSVAPGREAAT